MPTLCSWKQAVNARNGGLQDKTACSKSVYAKMDRNGPSSADQGLSTSKPSHGHAVCTLWVHPPTSPCPTLSAQFVTCFDSLYEDKVVHSSWICSVQPQNPQVLGNTPALQLDKARLEEPWVKSINSIGFIIPFFFFFFFFFLIPISSKYCTATSKHHQATWKGR